MQDSSMPRRRPLLLCGWGLVAAWALPLSAQAQTEQPPLELRRQTMEATDGLNYLLHLPEGHDPAKRWPLVLFLHGFGERSSENAEGQPFSALTVHSMPAVVESEDWDWPFIVVSPQIDEEGWVTRSGDLAALVDRMEAEHGADPNRMYLTGLSYGGRGTWEVGLQQSGRWAALMPLCSDPTGLEAPARAELAKRPLFVVHGTHDTTANDFRTMAAFIGDFASEGMPFYEFDYALSQEDDDLFPPEALQEPLVFARMRVYGHDVWSATYGRLNGPRKTVAFNWLLAQSLDGSDFLDPRSREYELANPAEPEPAPPPPQSLPAITTTSDDSGCSLSAAGEGAGKTGWLATGCLALALGLRRSRFCRGSALPPTQESPRAFLSRS